MTGYTEKTTAQQGLIDLLVAEGWECIPGHQLPRATQRVLIEQEALGAIERLNPHLVGRADTPAMVLDLIEHYATYDRQAEDGAVPTIELLPRYFQYEAVEAIVERAASEPGARGLVCHTQGSGKTLTMSWVATRLVLDPRMKNPTIVAVADRTQLTDSGCQEEGRSITASPFRNSPDSYLATRVVSKLYMSGR